MLASLFALWTLRSQEPQSAASSAQQKTDASSEHRARPRLRQPEGARAADGFRVNAERRLPVHVVVPVEAGAEVLLQSGEPEGHRAQQAMAAADLTTVGSSRSRRWRSAHGERGRCGELRRGRRPQSGVFAERQKHDWAVVHNTKSSGLVGLSCKR